MTQHIPFKFGNRFQANQFIPFQVLASLFLLVFALLILSVPANAIVTGITVNSTLDELIAANGNCTLREAILNANADADLTGGDCDAGSGADTIFLTSGTYTLSLIGNNDNGGDLNIWEDLTIEGDGADSTIVDATAVSSRVFKIQGTTTLSGITITGGHSGSNGGGILAAEANLNLINTVISENEADGLGGGVYMNTGEFTLTNSSIINNEADEEGGGLAISSSDTTATIDTSAISGNESELQGGGIAIKGATLSVTDSTISGNHATEGGGGIFNTHVGLVTISGTTISDNVVGGNIFASNRFGGGLKNVGSSTYMDIVNSTISGNSAADDGAGIYNNSSTLDLLNVTITNNHSLSDAGGIDNFGYVNVENSIVAGNTAVSNAPDCRSLFGWPLVSDGYNLFGNNTGCPVTATDLTVAPADLFTTVIDTLQDNGGNTATHALLVNSPALDTANTATCPATDQRGVSRPQFNLCDMGAYEAEDFVQPGPTFTVTNDSDIDDAVCTINDCSLREAINAANVSTGTNTITFEIEDQFIVTIYPDSALPTITDPLLIDGYANSNIVTLDGSDTEGSFNGLTISAGSSEIYGLTIQNFNEHGILLTTDGGNSIYDNIINGNGGDGIRVLDGIGNAINGNSIYDNTGLAIDLNGDGVTENDANDPDSGVNNLTNYPVIIRAVPDFDAIQVEGILNAEPNTDYTLEFYNNISCDSSGNGEGDYFIDSGYVTTDANGNASFNLTLYSEEEQNNLAQDPIVLNNVETAFITATATDENGNTSEFSRCGTTSPGNDSWPRSLDIPLLPDSVSPDVFLGSVTQLIDQQDQSRWFKFEVQPDSQLQVTLTNLPKNYDLTVYKDIAETYNALLNVNDADDLIQLGAEFAPDAFSPDAFSPDAFSPDAFSPDAFSPDAFSPDAFSPDIFSPDAFSPDAFSPDAFSPDAFAPDAFSPDAF
ncbi:MAG: CSLREA domain-containing protein [Chloroflexi bacterium]|nr:CSLREA domain-containing protein [Chloroflexota bacterium]